MIHLSKILAFLFFAFFFVSNRSAMAQTNIATKADSITTSFVSSWEKIGAINDGIEPASSSDKQGTAYGNWNSADNNRWHQVVYTWNQLYMISKSEIYWWTDGGGIQIPEETYLEYWDIVSKAWVEIDGSHGIGIKDQYHVVAFPVVLTNKIRVNMISSIATGILEWKVWGELGEQVPMNSSVSIDKNLEPGNTSHVTLTAMDAKGAPVEGYVFKIDVAIKNSMPTIDEAYQVAGTVMNDSLVGIELPATDNSGKVTFDLTLPASIDPKDGISVTPKFNSGMIGFGVAYVYTQQGKIAPSLTADQSENTVDNDIVITFADDVAWRAAVSNVFVNGIKLVQGIDFEIYEGKITLKPSGRNTILTVNGEKNLTVEATGYEDNVVSQSIFVGASSASQILIQTKNQLFKSVATQIVVVLKDQFGNLVRDASLTYDIDVINNNSTKNETYIVGYENITADFAGLKTAKSDTNGQIIIPLEIPSVVDLNDGIRISFKLEDGTLIESSVEYIAASTEKVILVQAGVKSQPDFSWARTAQSENFIIYWGEKVKGDPTDRSLNPSLWFNPNDILVWLEDIHTYLADTVGFLHKMDGNAAKYKYEIVMNNTWKNDVFTGWAFGGIADNVIGGMWIDPNSTRDDGVLSHEFTHVCQGMVKIDHPGYGIDTPWGGFFWESHANWMRSRYNKSHDGLIERYINTSMMHFGVTRRHYQNFAFLDYLVDQYGMQTINDIWHKANAKVDHPLTSLRDSVLHYSQDALNDDLARCAMRNVTWDYSVQKDIQQVIKNLDPASIGRECTILDSLKDESGKFIVPEYLAPGDYGYNIIPLYLNDGAASITVSFRVLENEVAGGAGSRYGFVAVDADGKARYSEIYSEKDATASFSIQSGDEKFYLVVMGAPKTHHNYEWEVGFPRVYRYPYVVGFDGAIPVGHKPGYNSQRGSLAGAPHSNGGGWVASTAKVDASVYVGPQAQVLKTAVVSGNVRIEDYAIVTDNAKISGNSIVRNHAIVGSSSMVNGDVVVEKTARVYNSSLKNDVTVTGSALLYNSTLSGSVIAKDLAYLYGVSLSGTVIIGGDAEEYTGCSSGTYLEIKRLGTCDGVVNHAYDQDVNPAWPEYIYPKGVKPTAPINLKGSNIKDKSVDLSWEASASPSAVSYYVLQADQVIATVTSNSYQVTGLEKGKAYTFQVQAIDPSGNRSERSNQLNVKTLTVGVDHLKDEGWIHVYPNPVIHDLQIKMVKDCQASVTIVDSSGQTVVHKLFSHELTIPRNEFGSSGIYVLKIESEKNSLSRTILVN